MGCVAVVRIVASSEVAGIYNYQKSVCAALAESVTLLPTLGGGLPSGRKDASSGRLDGTSATSSMTPTWKLPPQCYTTCLSWMAISRGTGGKKLNNLA
eukprot:5032073-Amphidinium_carterae.1